MARAQLHFSVDAVHLSERNELKTWDGYGIALGYFFLFNVIKLCGFLLLNQLSHVIITQWLILYNARRLQVWLYNAIIFVFKLLDYGLTCQML